MVGRALAPGRTYFVPAMTSGAVMMQKIDFRYLKITQIRNGYLLLLILYIVNYLKKCLKSVQRKPSINSISNDKYIPYKMVKSKNH